MFSYTKIIDISLPIHEGMIVYPGNPEVEIIEHKGATSVHSKIILGSHTGTHLDAPKHVFPDGAGTDAIALSALIGPCRVLDMTQVQDALRVADLEPHEIKGGERILIKTTNSRRGFRAFYDDYIYLDGAAADYLAEKRVALFGVDSLSVKRRGGADNRAHTSLLKNNVVILEGLDLSQVIPGDYTLACLPLALLNCDGAPARTLLLL